MAKHSGSSVAQSIVVKPLHVPPTVLNMTAKLPQTGDRFYILKSGKLADAYGKDTYNFGPSKFSASYCAICATGEKNVGKILEGQYFLSHNGEGAVHVKCLLQNQSAQAHMPRTYTRSIAAVAQEDSVHHRTFKSANGKKVFTSRSKRDAYDARCKAAGERLLQGRMKAGIVKTPTPTPTASPAPLAVAHDEDPREIARLRYEAELAAIEAAEQAAREPVIAYTGKVRGHKTMVWDSILAYAPQGEVQIVLVPVV